MHGQNHIKFPQYYLILSRPFNTQVVVFYGYNIARCTVLTFRRNLLLPCPTQLQTYVLKSIITL